MSDYIKRDDVFRVISTTSNIDIAFELVRNLASADVVERKTGKWVKKHDDVCWWYECSACCNKPLHNNWTINEVLSNYCPNCGAEMKP